MSDATAAGGARGALVIHLGPEELVIRKRYETLSIVNDILIGLWFIVGSFLFFSEATSYAATWLFVIGSVEMLIRPLIRFARHVHLRRFHPGESEAVAANDY
ncbi:YrhK family protein [Paramicrobacterium chengjingii]|uniref:YrhK family protein n=1 Tax=Paramicrobacterium chengjingii TaxID=2769067 RepID=A0ABX6YJ22_9MICO|nr:YrhK family protein [Microbacterium chengjingii]QPZ38797.1 YrhK family protein [Microbacterium chengjingii]